MRSSFRLLARLPQRKRCFSTVHDIGGDLLSFGVIPPATELAHWEQQCHAVFALLATRQYVSTDGLRRAIEDLTPHQYQTWSYYEKWAAGMAVLLLENGVVTPDELAQALFGDIEVNDDDPLFQAGDIVRVKTFVSSEWRRPHIRTPGYVYGVAGTIERVGSRHPDPSFLAFGLPAPAQYLYRVRFGQGDLWPEQSHSKDVVEVEIYQHWLERSSTANKADSNNDVQFLDHSAGDDCVHNHHHSHNHDDHHVHEPRPLVEQRAVDREGAPPPGSQLYHSLYKLILDKGLLSAEEVQAMVEKLDTAGKRLLGADLVVESWLDDSFRQLLLINANEAAASLGITASNPNAPTVLTVVPHTPTVHNLIVCTLCSCYPSALLGIAPTWYKSRTYRARAVREPRVVLQEFGLDLNKPVVRVHDSTADHRYMVLPEQPPETQGWSKEDLRSIVTRDCMLGVAVPKASRGE